MEGASGSEQEELPLSDIPAITRAECESVEYPEISRPSRWPWTGGIVTIPRKVL